MYNKLPNRQNQVLLNILVCLPVLFLLAGVMLSEEIIFISSLPFKKYLLYVVAAFPLTYLYYRFLMPLHETGHYLVALIIKKKLHLDVKIWMDKKHTFCSRWKAYNEKQAVMILCAGMLFKIIYCIGIILLFLKLNIKYGMITFIYVIWFEIVLNAFPILKESDGYKMIHIDAFYDEGIIEPNKREWLFVKKVYPWLLIGITIVAIILFFLIEKGLMALADYLIL